MVDNVLIIDHDILLDCAAEMEFYLDIVEDTINLYEINENVAFDCGMHNKNIKLEIGYFNSGSYILNVFHRANSDINNDTILLGQFDFTVDPGYNAINILNSSVSCVSQDYHKFPVSNAAWHTVGYSINTDDIWSFRYAIYGDTIINSVEYSKVYEMSDTIISDPDNSYFAAIRENDKKQVFAKIPGFPESILYDFSLEVGDTICYDIGALIAVNDVWFDELTHCKFVTEIDSFILNNQEYRKSWVLENYYGCQFRWIEGIGSIMQYGYGLFNPFIYSTSDGGDYYNFACFKHNDEILYLNNPYGDSCFCGYTTSIKKTDADKQDILTLIPNPAKDIVTVSVNLDYQTNLKLTITDIAGNKIETFTNIDNEITINLSDYDSGLYLIQVFDKKDILLDSEKLIIN